MFVDHSILALPPEIAYAKLQEVMEADPQHPDSWYARWWSADAQVLLGDLHKAIAEHPPPSSARATMQMERLLSLKAEVGVPYTAAEALALVGPKLTAFGRQNIEQVIAAADAVMEADPGADHAAQLREWAQRAPVSPFQVYLGSAHGYSASKSLTLSTYRFSSVPAFVTTIQALARTAENMVRQDYGLPAVGQGWISETHLYKQIKEALPGVEVLQHASPPWLGRQHLDVYIPALQTAMEYQGIQHDRPVEFFGGEEAFAATRARDERKLRLCRRHGVRIIYVRAGYELHDVLAQIERE